MENHESNTQRLAQPPISYAKAGGSNCPPANSTRLMLNSAVNSRRTMARIMRMYMAGELENVQFRNLVYGFSTILQFFKAENEAELMKRIELMEAQLEAIK